MKSPGIEVEGSGPPTNINMNPCDFKQFYFKQLLQELEEFAFRGIPDARLYQQKTTKDETHSEEMVRCVCYLDARVLKGIEI